MSADAARRPVPRPTAITQPFWDACRDRRLIVQRCDRCATHVFIPQAFCSACRSTELSWVESTGLGAVVSFTEVWRPQTTAFDAPYTVAVVRLDEGHEMMTNLVGEGRADVAIGDRVRVAFVDVDADVTLPCFELDPTEVTS